MAVSKSRIKTEKIVENNKKSSAGAGASGTPDIAQVMDLQPKGLTDLLPTNITQFSSLKDITSFFASAIDKFTGNVNRALSVPSLAEMRKTLSNDHNMNQNTVNATLGVFEAILCGSDESLDFNLDDLIKALDYKFDFLQSWNICGRQGIKNPVDTILKSVNNIEKNMCKLTNTLINLDKRLLNNLQHSVKKLIKSLKLPKDLENCMLDNALNNMNIKYRNGITPGLANQLRDALTPSVCKKSDSGVPGYSREIVRASYSPLVSGLQNYDRKTMYAFAGALLGSDEVDNAIMLDVLTSCINGDENKNTLKILELIAFLKIVPYVSTASNSTSLSNITNNIHRVDNSEEIILDSILEATESQTTLDPIKVVTAPKTTISMANMEAVSKISYEDILTTMKDDTSASINPEKDLNNTLKLIQIADKTFDPSKHVIKIAECESIGNLAIMSMHSKNVANTIYSQTDVGGIQYTDVDEELTLDELIGVAAHFEDYAACEKSISA